MPWRERSKMSLRVEFVESAGAPGANVRALCRHFGISPTTGYTWLTRHREAGEAGLADGSTRPTRSPGRTAPATEARVVALRADHPTWGGRKLRRRLQDLGEPAPAPSTITAILQRHGLIDPAASLAHRPWRRFVAPAPNDLWQIDFTGHFALEQGRCHPFPVVDDHSRYLLCLQACADQTGSTVRTHLTALFRACGMPSRLPCDNGAPWGTRADHDLTALSVWLIRPGIRVLHGRPRHPQTQGKLERLNRTLGADVIPARRYADLPDVRTAFDAWRQVYNHERPHGSLNLDTPSRHYAASDRAFPETLAEVAYADGDEIKVVNAAGMIAHWRKPWRISHAVAGLPVALRPTGVDGVVDVRFCGQLVCASGRTVPRRAGAPCEP